MRAADGGIRDWRFDGGGGGCVLLRRRVIAKWIRIFAGNAVKTGFVTRSKGRVGWNSSRLTREDRYNVHIFFCAFLFLPMFCRF